MPGACVAGSSASYGMSHSTQRGLDTGLPPSTLVALESRCKDDTVSDWERQRQKRIDILDVLKSKPAYQAFNSERPREARNRFFEPMTPDPCEPQSKRRWETRFHAFKSRANEWYAEFRRTTRSREGQEEEQTGSRKDPQEFHCDDPRHYALSVCCQYAGLWCSCKDGRM